MLKVNSLFLLSLGAILSLTTAADESNDELTGAAEQQQKPLNSARVLASKFTLSQVLTV